VTEVKVVTESQVQGIGVWWQLICSAHNRQLSRSTRGTHLNKQQGHKLWLRE